MSTPLAPTADDIRDGKDRNDRQIEELVAAARDELANGSEPAAVYGLLTLAMLDATPQSDWGGFAALAAAGAVRIAEEQAARR